MRCAVWQNIKDVILDLCWLRFIYIYIYALLTQKMHINVLTSHFVHATHVIQPYLRVNHVENYVIHHHVVLHGGSRNKNADLKIISSSSKKQLKYGIKGKHPLVRWCESGDHLLASGVGILRPRPRIPPPDASKWSPSSHHPTRGVFLYDPSPSTPLGTAHWIQSN